jgi:hypothetical protein
MSIPAAPVCHAGTRTDEKGPAIWVTGKDGNPINEVELLSDSLMNNGGVRRGNSVVKLVPDQTVTKIGIGEQIALDDAQFERLAWAFLADLEAKFVEASGPWGRESALDRVVDLRDLRRAGVGAELRHDRNERLAELLERCLRVPHVEDVEAVAALERDVVEATRRCSLARRVEALDARVVLLLAERFGREVEAERHVAAFPRR